MHVALNFLGQIPSIEDANRREAVFTLPWQEKPLELGKVFASQIGLLNLINTKVEVFKYLVYMTSCSNMYSSLFSC